MNWSMNPASSPGATTCTPAAGRWSRGFARPAASFATSLELPPPMETESDVAAEYFGISVDPSAAVDEKRLICVANATVTGQQLIDSVSASVTQNITPTIWSVRLRSYNALGNPSFEVDQATGGGALTIGAGTNTVDRWSAIKVGTMAATAQKRAELIPVPGTSFCISQYYLRITLTTASVF